MSNKIVPIAATIYWPFFNKVNELSGKYQVDISNLSSAAVEELSMMGIDIRNKGDERGDFITCKSTYPIDVSFKGDAVDPSLVGNGSKATIAIGTYAWKYMNKQGVSPSIKKLLITDVEVYEDKTLDGIDLDAAI
jgi:hypothetical protein